MSGGGEPVAVHDLDRVDHECDVLVVGMGAAGAAAAIEAAAGGVRVTALERFSGAGGSSAQSGGEVYLGGGTALQQECGVEDDVASMYAYLHEALGPHVDEEKLRLYCDGSVEHFAWLRDAGVPFRPALHESPGWMPPNDAGLMWLGEAAWPFRDLARPAPRGHRPAAPWFAGGELMRALSAAVEAAGVEVHLDTRATALVVDDSVVVGLRARRFGGTLTYRAGAVVLTTGGFVDNDQMLAEHAPVLLGHGKVSDGGDDGSGIRMATALGAATRRMGSVQVAMLVQPAMACRGILVNALGQRFVNEDVYPGRYSEAALLHQPGPWWLVMDERGFEEVPAEDSWGLQPQHAAETAEELGDDLGMPPGALAATIEAYNRHAASGADPWFHKTGRWLRPLEPPYAAFDPRVAGAAGGTPTGFSGFTLGGLRTSVDGEVQHVSGHAVPGLYAAGRAAAGIHGEGYVSGTSLGDGTFFGRRAGRAAALRSTSRRDT